MFARIMTVLVAASAEQETIVIDEACLNALCKVGSHAKVQGFQPSTTAPDGKPLVFIPLKSNAPPIPIGVLSAKGAMKRRACATFLQHCIKKMIP